MAIHAESVEVGDNGSSSHEGVVCILAMISVKTLVGDTIEEADRGVCGSEGVPFVLASAISRAGFGNVLYVEPRDVYLQMWSQICNRDQEL